MTKKLLIGAGVLVVLLVVVLVLVVVMVVVMMMVMLWYGRSLIAFVYAPLEEIQRLADRITVLRNGEFVGVAPTDLAGAKPVVFPKPAW